MPGERSRAAISVGRGPGNRFEAAKARHGLGTHGGERRHWLGDQITVERLELVEMDCSGGGSYFDWSFRLLADGTGSRPKNSGIEADHQRRIAEVWVRERWKPAVHF